MKAELFDVVYIFKNYNDSIPGGIDVYKRIRFTGTRLECLEYYYKETINSLGGGLYTMAYFDIEKHFDTTDKKRKCKNIK